MKPLNSLDMFMIGTYSESIIVNGNAYVSDYEGIAYELLYINPNYNFNFDVNSLKNWAEFYNCYDETTKSIILSDNIIELVKSYENIAKHIKNNIYEDFIEASKKHHSKKESGLTLRRWFN